MNVKLLYTFVHHLYIFPTHLFHFLGTSLLEISFPMDNDGPFAKNTFSVRLESFPPWCSTPTTWRPKWPKCEVRCRENRRPRWRFWWVRRILRCWCFESFLFVEPVFLFRIFLHLLTLSGEVPVEESLVHGRCCWQRGHECRWVEAELPYGNQLLGVIAQEELEQRALNLVGGWCQAGWGFQPLQPKYWGYFHPDFLGKWSSNLTVRIFFETDGNQPPTSKVHGFEPRFQQLMIRVKLWRLCQEEFHNLIS